MKILGLLGSPRENGNTAVLLKAVCDSAKQNGHDVEILNLAKMNIQACLSCDACKTGKVKYCALKDDMQEIYPKLLESDLAIFATPVYLAQVTAQMKKFLDRWYAFMDADHRMRSFDGGKAIGGRKAVVIATSGAPWYVFSRGVAGWMKFVLRFFKLKTVASICAGGMREASSENQPKLIRRAREVGERL